MNAKFLTLAVSLISIFSVNNAEAYSLLGWKWRESERPLPYYINSKDAPSGFAHEIIKSAEVWSKDKRFDFEFRYVGTSSSQSVTRSDNRHVVYWNKSGAGMDETTLAATYHWSAGTRVLHFDMAFNGTHNWVVHPSSNAYDIQTVAIHEFGHALGLDHSEFWSAIMYYAAPLGRMKRLLNNDDVAAAAELYPPKQVVLKPEAARLQAPLGTINETRPSFRWQASKNTDSYSLIVNRIVDGGKIVVMRLNNLKTTSVNSSASFQAGSTYTWQVISVSNSGQSAVSTLASFQVKTARPTSPVIVSPGRITNSKRPAFTWRPVNGATKYFIYISEIGGRNGIVHYELDSNAFYPNFDMNHSRGYYWWVRAANSTESSQWVGNTLIVR